MEYALPPTFDYSKPVAEMPEVVSSTLMSIQSTNGISFTSGQVIQFDAPARKDLHIDGKSAYLRFKMSFTATTTSISNIRRKPALSVFSRLDEYIGSTPVNSVSQYNQCANMWVDLNMSLADVWGQQVSFGLAKGTNDSSLVDIDGSTLPSGTTSYYVAVPLYCSFLQGADKMLPTGFMAPYRLTLTVDSITNIVNEGTAGNITAFTITQPELCFSAVSIPGIDDSVASIPRIIIKARAWANAAQSLASGSSNAQTLVYNHRYASIENLFLLATGTATAKSVNLWGDYFNVLGSEGTVGTMSFTIGTQQYPQLPFNNATGGYSAILQMCRETVGQICDQRNSMSLFGQNFSATASYAGNSTVTTADVPAKVVYAVPLSRVNAPSPYQQLGLLSGVSAASTPINVNMVIGTPTNNALNVNLIAEYSELLEIDTMSRQVRVIA